MKEVAKIIGFLLGVILLGALLTPLIFWILRALEPWALANGFMNWDPHESQVVVHGWLGFLTTDFPRCFGPALLLAFLIFYIPILRSLEISSRRGLRLFPDARRSGHLGRGLLLGGGPVAVLGTGCFLANLSRVHVPPTWDQAPKVVLLAVALGLLEEFVFRGALFGILLKAMPPFVALSFTTLLFSVFCFLQPPAGLAFHHVTWLSGLDLFPHLFEQFQDRAALLTGFLPLCIAGWMLGYARMRTQALWMSVGMRVGMLLVLSSYNTFTTGNATILPWIGHELQIGVATAAAFLIGHGLAWWRLEHEELLPNPKSRD